MIMYTKLLHSSLLRIGDYYITAERANIEFILILCKMFLPQICGGQNGQHTVKLSGVRQGRFSDERHKDLSEINVLEIQATG